MIVRTLITTAILAGLSLSQPAFSDANYPFTKKIDQTFQVAIQNLDADTLLINSYQCGGLLMILGKTGYLQGENIEELGVSYFAAFFNLALGNHLAVSNPDVKLSDLSKEQKIEQVMAFRSVWENEVNLRYTVYANWINAAGFDYRVLNEAGHPLTRDKTTCFSVADKLLKQNL